MQGIWLTHCICSRHANLTKVHLVCASLNQVRLVCAACVSTFPTAICTCIMTLPSSVCKRVNSSILQVPDEDLVDRVAGRRLDPETGDIYHMKHKPPPEDIEHRLIQRSDDTAEKVKTRLHNHHSNVDAVLGYYQDQLVEVSWLGHDNNPI